MMIVFFVYSHSPSTHTQPLSSLSSHHVRVLGGHDVRVDASPRHRGAQRGQLGARGRGGSGGRRRRVSSGGAGSGARHGGQTGGEGAGRGGSLCVGEIGRVGASGRCTHAHKHTHTPQPPLSPHLAERCASHSGAQGGCHAEGGALGETHAKEGRTRRGGECERSEGITVFRRFLCHFVPHNTRAHG